MTVMQQVAGGPQLGFAEPAGEIEVAELPLEGELPAWLTGSLVRVTPARWETGDTSLRHWFDGLAMLHGFAIDGGRVSYANRWLRSKQFEAVERDGKIAYSEFASDPCRSLFKRVTTLFNPVSALTDNGVVNIVKLGEEYLALTETPLPVAFDGDTLDTLGVTGWAGDIPGVLTTAHPHGDRGEMINYAAHLGPVNSYRIYTLAPGGKPRVAARKRVRKPAYMHSFGLTERFYVLAEYPYVVDPLRLAAARRPFIENFEWEPERGTKFHLFDRASGDRRATFEAPPGFAFHFVNCYEDGQEVVADVCVYDDPSIIDTLYMDGIDSRVGGSPPPLLTRYRLDLATGECATEQLTEIPFELPRIDYGRRNGKPYRYTYGISSNDAASWPNVLAKVDVSDGSFDLWHEPGCYPSEPVFVRDPAGTAEDDGVALSVVLDSASGRSFMLVLDARTWQERARAEAPQHVPFGFHGQFFQS
jgi:carotenoid cleavage dioxygenase-like enzyme